MKYNDEVSIHVSGNLARTDTDLHDSSTISTCCDQHVVFFPTLYSYPAFHIPCTTCTGCRIFETNSTKCADRLTSVISLPVIHP